MGFVISKTMNDRDIDIDDDNITNNWEKCQHIKFNFYDYDDILSLFHQKYNYYNNQINKNNLFCQFCYHNHKPIYLCLQCGIFCSHHIGYHIYNSQLSPPHYLTLNLSSREIKCWKCNVILYSYISSFPRGLPNDHNICYLNATLQCLFFCKPFKSLLSSLFPILSIDTPFTSHLYQLFSQLSLFIIESNQREKTEKTVLELIENYLLKISLFLSKNQYFNFFGQHDCQECLTSILDILQKEESLYSYISSINTFSLYSPSLLSLFKIKLINFFYCGLCKGFWTKKDISYDLSLSLLSHSNPNVYFTSINRCIEYYFSSEKIAGLACHHCHHKTHISKQTFIESPPDILVLQLKRYNHRYKENLYAQVHLPSPLSISTSSPSSIISNHNHHNYQNTYDLNSFTLHHGSLLNSGHYITIVKHQGLWYIINDEEVQMIDEKQLLQHSQSPSIYTLFYIKRKIK